MANFFQEFWSDINALSPTMSAADFKTHCLAAMDAVNKQRLPIVITKRGKPVAKLVPIDVETPDQPTAFGFMANHITIHGDIVASLEEPWESDV